MPVHGLISHIDLNVSDPRRSIPFYSVLLEALGWQRAWLIPKEGRESMEQVGRDDRCAWWTLMAGAGINIEVRPPVKSLVRDRHERYAPGLDHLAFHAASNPGVDATYEALVHAGVTVGDPPRDYGNGYYALGVDDPDGIHLEVVYEPTSNP